MARYNTAQHSTASRVGLDWGSDWGSDWMGLREVRALPGIFFFCFVLFISAFD